jgi:hypothetical protein
MNLKPAVGMVANRHKRPKIKDFFQGRYRDLFHPAGEVNPNSK